MLLALLTAFGPLSIDMYLPALPMMAEDFGVPTSTIAHSVPAYFLGLALGQLFYGPWSDRIGRKTPLYIGLLLYSAASLACVFAQDEWTLIVARIFQALGGCVGVVVARAAIRDRLDTQAAANAFAKMMMVMTIAPIVAPTIGAWLIYFFSWQSIFILLSILGLLCLLCVHFSFQETLAPEKRLDLSMSQVGRLYQLTLADRSFYIPMLIGCTFSSVLFAYISGSATVLIDGYGLTEQVFAYVFGINAIGILFLSSLNKRLLARGSIYQVLSLGAAVQASGAFILLFSAFAGLSVWWVLGGFLLSVSGIGLTGPNSMALAMQHQKERAGTASALLGCIQYLLGLLVGVLVNLLPFTALLNIAMCMFALAVSGFVLIHLAKKTAVQAA